MEIGMAGPSVEPLTGVLAALHPRMAGPQPGASPRLCSPLRILVTATQWPSPRNLVTLGEAPPPEAQNISYLSVILFFCLIRKWE